MGPAEIVQLVTSLISNVGFPIVCVIAMFWMVNRQNERHAEESTKWVEAINNNTKAMEEVCKIVRNGAG